MPHFICIKDMYINIDHIIRFYTKENELVIIMTEMARSGYGDTSISQSIGFKFKDSDECQEKLETLNKVLMTFNGCSVTVI